MSYTKINFENSPSTNTPVNATNLNAMQTNAENAINAVSQKIDKKIKNISFGNSDTYTFTFTGYGGVILALIQTNYTTKQRTVANIITCLANDYFTSSLDDGFYSPNITHTFDANTNIHTFTISAYMWGSGILIASGDLS